MSERHSKPVGNTLPDEWSPEGDGRSGARLAGFAHEYLYEQLDLWMVLEAGPGGPSRTAAHWKRAPVAYRTAAPEGRRPDLQRELERAPLSVEKASPAAGRQLVDLAREAMIQDKPLLAICRGHQVLNVALGGTLYEDVTAWMPGAIKHDYFELFPRNHTAHAVAIEPDSKLAAALGRREAQVNSLHHQGIRDLAPGLVAVAHAPDGLIESVEGVDHPFALGVQWHPENLVHDDPVMLSLFRGLVDAARTN